MSTDWIQNYDVWIIVSCNWSCLEMHNILLYSTQNTKKILFLFLQITNLVSIIKYTTLAKYRVLAELLLCYRFNQTKTHKKTNVK